MRIVPYRECSSDAKRWDDFIALSCNGNFLHSRRFLSYHRDHFEDCSVFLEDDKGRLLGLFPAAFLPDDRKTVCSHPGATYGGIVNKGDRKAQLVMEEAVASLIEYYRKKGAGSLIYKEVPHIYTRTPANSDVFALYRAGFKIERCSLAAIVSPCFKKMSESRKQELKKAISAGTAVRVATDPGEQRQLWQIIESNLLEHYQVKPAHSWQEIRELFELFPESISFILAEVKGSLEGGLICFDFPAVVHVQYMAASERGKELFVLGYALFKAYEEASKAQKWFSLGNSSNQDGSLNLDLHSFKAGLGGGAFVLRAYRLDF